MSESTTVRLRDLGEWMGGNTPSKGNAAYWTNGTIPWVSPKDMKVDEIASSEDRVTEAALAEGRVSMVPEGSVLFVTRSGILAHTLPVAVTKLPVTINQDLKALKPKAGISPKYVAHAVRGASRRILKQCSKHGTTVASIETNTLLDFAIPMVELDEQHRIVAEIEKQFSRLDEAIANVKTAKARLSAYRASVLSGVQRGALCGLNSGDWPVRAIGELATRVQYGSSAKTSAVETGIPVLRMGNIQNGELVLDALKYLPADHDEFPELFLETGDVLFNRTNSPELVGKVAVYKGSPAPCSFASYLIRLRFTDEVVPEYVALVVNSPFGRAWVRAVVSQQVGQANVNGSKLKALQFRLPPINLQRKLVAEAERHLSMMRETEAQLAAAEQRSERLRGRLLANAFPELGAQEK